MFNPLTNETTEYNIPTPNSTATNIAADSQGDIWFSELTSNKLGEWRDGSIVEYPIPGGTVLVAGQSEEQACGPTQVVPDKLGHIWVICIFSNQIDEFFPGNDTFYSFDLPIFQSGPAGLVFDNSGNFWFTAADSNMIGRGIISELENGTSDGITEFAPLNQTYTFTFQKTMNLEGQTKSEKSSLPTPSGIALSPDGNTLWISEHVDSSFDSYNIKTGSLDRYWTSNTENQYGYPISFPNGIAIDSSGTVWIAEHYGNKVAEFDPSTDSLTEYAVPCCGSSIAGVYTLTLGKNGTIWFVEIQGNAIGELAPIFGRQQGGGTVDLQLGESQISMKATSSAIVPINVAYDAPGSNGTTVNLDISGMSSTGALQNLAASFNPSVFQISGSGNETGALDLSGSSLKPGVYDLTISARAYNDTVIYSRILKLVVVGSSSTTYNGLLIYGAVIGIVFSLIVIGALALFQNKRRVRRAPSASSRRQRRSRIVRG